MPTLSSMQIPPPKDWEEFQEITLSSLKVKWGNPNLTRNGRLGQSQNGVDISGNDERGYLVGVQCKLHLKDIKEVKDEANAAESFKPPIKAFYMATTSTSDVRLQEDVRILSQERESMGKFPIGIFFWEDLIQELLRDKDEFNKHYPEITMTKISDQSYIFEITSTLEKIGRLQLRLVEENTEKVAIQLLAQIQKELQQQWKIPEYYPYQDVDVKTMSIIFNRTTKKMGISTGPKLDDRTVEVIRRIGWTLDKYEIGLTKLQQKNDEYKTLCCRLSDLRAKNKIKPKTNDSIKRFLFFLYGIDSLYIFYKYAPSSHINKFPSQSHIVFSQYQQTRDEALKELLINIQQST